MNKKIITNKSSKIINVTHYSNTSFNHDNANKMKKMLDKINNKNLQYLFFNFWKTKISS